MSERVLPDDLVAIMRRPGVKPGCARTKRDPRTPEEWRQHYLREADRLLSMSREYQRQADARGDKDLTRQAAIHAQLADYNKKAAQLQAEIHNGLSEEDAILREEAWGLVRANRAKLAKMEPNPFKPGPLPPSPASVKR